MAIGIQPFYSTIGGKKPVVVGVAVTPVDGVQKNATILFGELMPRGGTSIFPQHTVVMYYGTAGGGARSEPCGSCGSAGPMSTRLRGPPDSRGMPAITSPSAFVSVPGASANPS